MTCVCAGEFLGARRGSWVRLRCLHEGNPPVNSARFLSTSTVPFAWELEFAGALGEMGIDVR